MAARKWLVGIAAVSLMLLGGIAVAPTLGVAQEGAEPSSDPEITEDQAREIALDANPGTDVLRLELEEEDGKQIYEVELSSGVEVEIDAMTGEIVANERDDEAETDREDDEEALLGEVALSPVEAARIAVEENPNAEVVEIGLEQEDNLAAYEVELSNGVEVEIDANSGKILESEQDDENADADEVVLDLSKDMISIDELRKIVLADQSGAGIQAIGLEVDDCFAWAEGGCQEAVEPIQVYEVELTNGVEVTIDALTAEVLSVEQEVEDQ